MNKDLVVSEIDIIFLGKSWETITLSDGAQIIKPKYMVKNIDWTSISQLIHSKVPFIKVCFSGGVISSLEAHSGIVREVPIFYTYSDIDQKLILLDSPKNLIEKNSNINELSIQEFLTFGYVTADRTLVSGVFSLEAGEKLTYNGLNAIIETEYLYNSINISKENNEELKSEFKIISEQVFDELIKDLKGKTAIIPLSAGYDSRYIASMLKMGGFENVLCYAWGKPTNEDIEISRKIASKLDYKWHAIDYSQQSWEDVFKTDWFETTLVNSSNFTSISGAASFPFLKHLIDNLDLDRCVLLSGHSIGGLATHDLLTHKTTKSELMKVIKTKNSLVDSDLINEGVSSEISIQIDKYLSKVETYKIYEIMRLKERHSKFITNTNRYYEELGVDWGMPLYDFRFSKFWDGVPLSEKKHFKLYNELLEDTFKETGVDFALKNVKKSSNNLFIQSYQILKKVSFFRNMVQSLLKNKPKKDEFGFNLSLPLLHEQTVQKYPRGFETMNKYCNEYKIDPPTNKYDYLTRTVLALLLEEFERTKS